MRSQAISTCHQISLWWSHQEEDTGAWDVEEIRNAYKILT